MSIFDSIVGSLSSFGDAIAQNAPQSLSAAYSKSGETAAAKAYYQENSQAGRESRILNMLRMGDTSQPYPSYSFRAGQSQPAPTANPDEINQQWLQRLSRYSQMPVYEGGRAK